MRDAMSALVKKKTKLSVVERIALTKSYRLLEPVFFPVFRIVKKIGPKKFRRPSGGVFSIEKIIYNVDFSILVVYEFIIIHLYIFKKHCWYPEEQHTNQSIRLRKYWWNKNTKHIP